MSAVQDTTKSKKIFSLCHYVVLAAFALNTSSIIILFNFFDVGLKNSDLVNRFELIFKISKHLCISAGIIFLPLLAVYLKRKFPEFDYVANYEIRLRLGSQKISKKRMLEKIILGILFSVIFLFFGDRGFIYLMQLITVCEDAALFVAYFLYSIVSPFLYPGLMMVSLALIQMIERSE